MRLIRKGYRRAGGCTVVAVSLSNHISVVLPVHDQEQRNKPIRLYTKAIGQRHARSPRPEPRGQHWYQRHMTAGPPQAGPEWFTAPEQVNHRRYEALRAFFVDGLTHAQAAERFGYTRWGMVNLVRDYRAGKLTLFAPPGKPGPPAGVAPAKDRARGRVIELRREGLSSYEISRRLAAEGTPLNRTGVAEILTEEGFGRLLRHPQPAASINPATPGRDTRLPRTGKLDWGTWPDRVETGKAGLLLLDPGPGRLRPARPGGRRRLPRHPRGARPVLAGLAAGAQADPHPPGLARGRPAAGRPGRRTVRRPVRAAEEVGADRLLLPHHARAPAPPARRPGPEDDQRRAGHGRRGDLRSGLPRRDALGRRPGTREALRAHPIPTRPKRVLTFFAQDCGTHNLVYANADLTKASQAREVIAFCDHWKNTSAATDPAMLIMDQKVTTQPVLAELDARGIKFLTLRMRSPALRRADQRPDRQRDFKTVTLNRPGKFNRPKVHDSRARMTGYPGTVRQLIVTGLGRQAPTVIITNNDQLPAKALIEHYARRMTIEERLAEIIRAFHADALSSTVNLNVDLDIALCVLAQALVAAFRNRLTGYQNVTPDVIQRRFLETPGTITTTKTPSPSDSTGAPTAPSYAPPTYPMTPPFPGGAAAPCATKSANPCPEPAAWKSALGNLFDLEGMGLPLNPRGF